MTGSGVPRLLFFVNGGLRFANPPFALQSNCNLCANENCFPCRYTDR